MRLKKVHRVLELEQERWTKPYIDMNTNFRKKAKNDFKKNFYKLMNNSVFGKTTENLRNRVDIKLVRAHENDNKIRKLVANPLYSRHVFFADNLAGMQIHKSSLFLNKPVYVGMTILENSNFLKMKYGEKCQLLYTDTDSLLLKIETEDIYKDMEQNADLFDTSDYPAGHPLHPTRTKRSWAK